MIRVDRRLKAMDVQDALTDLLLQRGRPQFIGSDNGPGFIARKLRDRIEPIRAKTACMAPGSPWETADHEDFDARFRDELPNGEVCHALK